MFTHPTLPAISDSHAHHRTYLITVGLLVMLLLLVSRVAGAHCDGMDGPVVTAAKQALDKSDVNLVLIWIKPDSERAVRQAYKRALDARKAGKPNDMPFFETVVREHRAGEGEPFQGIQPAGRDLGPAISALDTGLQDNSNSELEKVLTETVRDGIRQRFDRVQSLRNYSADNLEAGRAYVSAYVDYVHYAEELYEKAAGYAGPSRQLHLQDAKHKR